MKFVVAGAIFFVLTLQGWVTSHVMADEIEVPQPRVLRTSIDRLQKRCDQMPRGDAKACEEAGLRYQRGDGVVADLAKAADLFSRGCTLGRIPACIDLAALKLEGLGTPKDVPGGIGLLRNGCKSSNGRACAGLGTLALKGKLDGAPSRTKAGDFYKKACKLESGWGCGLLAALRLGERKPDYKGARQIARQGCRLGDSPACALYGKLALAGRGGPKEPKRAANAFLRACKAGDTAACRQLAAMYRKGTGVGANPEVAARILKAACDAKDARACGSLGQMCIKGEGVAIDYACARRRFTQACEAGDGQACTNLGVMHIRGLRVMKSAKAAARLYRKGCKAGHKAGCTALAKLCETGETSACSPP